jgi:hypothetical protein
MASAAIELTIGASFIARNLAQAVLLALAHARLSARILAFLGETGYEPG